MFADWVLGLCVDSVVPSDKSTELGDADLRSFSV